MKKNEIAIIIDRYSELFKLKPNDWDKEEPLFELRIILDKLGLKKQRYEAENKAIMEHKEIRLIEREAFKMLFDDFVKYNRYVEFDIADIEMHFDDIKFDMTEEQIKCNKARIRMLKEIA